MHTVFSNAACMSSKSDLTVQQSTRKLCTREKKIILQSTVQFVLFFYIPLLSETREKNVLVYTMHLP
jgi:hypothetical protein